MLLANGIELKWLVHPQVIFFYYVYIYHVVLDCT